MTLLETNPNGQLGAGSPDDVLRRPVASTTRRIAGAPSHPAHHSAGHPGLEPFRVLVTLHHHSDRRTVEAALGRLGFDVRATAEALAAEALLRTFEPDVIVVDARDAYPTLNPVLSQVHRCPNIRVVAVGANSDDQRLTVLRNGADDAIPTDASADEIALRCKVLLRRVDTPRAVTPPVVETPKVIHIGPLSIDFGRREIKVRGHVVASTKLEFELFSTICKNPLEVSSRTHLIESVWGPHWVGDTHVVDVHLSNLRRKLRERAPELQFMHTVRGVGFRLSDDLLDLASRDLASSIYLDAKSA